MIALLSSILLISVTMKPSISPWSLVPRDALAVRKANLREGVAYNDKWIPAYIKGEKNLDPYFQDLVHPFDGYQQELDKLIKDKREMARALAYHERIRSYIAKNQMSLATKPLLAMLKDVPNLTSNPARELASEAVGFIAAIDSELATEGLKAIWKNDDQNLNQWLIGVEWASRWSDKGSVLTSAERSAVTGSPTSLLKSELLTATETPFAPEREPQLTEFTTLEGTPLSLKRWRGKPIVLLKTAWWCGACRNELPELAQIFQKAKRKGLQVVLYSGDFDMSVTSSWMKTANCDVPVVWGGGALTLKSSFFVDRGWPQIFKIGKDFKVSRDRSNDPKERVIMLKEWLDTEVPRWDK